MLLKLREGICRPCRDAGDSEPGVDIVLRRISVTVTAIAIHRWRTLNEKERADEPNAAATRWRVSPHPSPQSGFDGLPRQHWHLELLRVRGGEPHDWVVEAPDAASHLALPAVSAERSAATAGPRRAIAG